MACKENTTRLWELSVRLYALFTDCPKGTMPYKEPVKQDILYGRRVLIRRLIDKIHRITVKNDRRWRTHNIPWKRDELLAQMTKDLGEGSVRDPEAIARRLTNDLFYYSDRFSMTRASRLRLTWEYFESLMSPSGVH